MCDAGSRAAEAIHGALFAEFAKLVWWAPTRLAFQFVRVLMGPLHVPSRFRRITPFSEPWRRRTGRYSRKTKKQVRATPVMRPFSIHPLR